MTIHPQIIEKEGKKEFVVLPYEEFQVIQEDLKVLRTEQREYAHAPTRPLDDVLREIGE